MQFAKMQIVILDLLIILIRNQSTVNYVLFLDNRFLAHNFGENRFDSDSLIFERNYKPFGKFSFIHINSFEGIHMNELKLEMKIMYHNGFTTNESCLRNVISRLLVVFPCTVRWWVFRSRFLKQRIKRSTRITRTFNQTYVQQTLNHEEIFICVSGKRKNQVTLNILHH